MTRPTFLVIGALKAGTTSLYHYLRSHPEVFMPDTKELRFFVDNPRFGTWNRGQAWYEECFAGAGDASAIGEASPFYAMATVFPGVPGRIAAMLPEVKLIYLLRHPIERILSQYRMYVASGDETEPAEVAFRTRKAYVTTSQYALQLERYLQHVPRERILLLTAEEMRRERRVVLARAFEFLGVDPGFVPPNLEEERNRGEDLKVRPEAVRRLTSRPWYRTLSRVAPRPMRRAVYRAIGRPLDPSLAVISAELREELLTHLRPDVARLRRHMPPEFDGWGIV